MRMLILIAAAALGSCAFGAEANVCVELPPLPGPWRAAFPDLRCLLVCTDAGGAERSTLLAGWDSGTVVTCDKAGNTPLLAYPVSSRDPDADPPGALRPAGGTYPGSLVDQPEGSVLRLTWVDGAAATVLLRLRSAGRDTSLFNAARLIKEMRKAADPWDLDLAAIAGAIAGGEFCVYDIDELPRRDVLLSDAEGEWVLESPLRDALTAGPDGTVRLTGLPLGAHSLFSLDGRVMRIEVRERETITLRIR